MITHPTCDIPLTSYISDSFAPNKCDAFNLSSSRCLSGRDINYHVTVTVRLNALQHCAAALYCSFLHAAGYFLMDYNFPTVEGGDNDGHFSKYPLKCIITTVFTLSFFWPVTALSSGLFYACLLFHWSSAVLQSCSPAVPVLLSRQSASVVTTRPVSVCSVG